MSRLAVLVATLALSATLPAAAQTTYKFKVYSGKSGAALRYYDINKTLQVVAETFPTSGNPTCALLTKQNPTPIADSNGSFTQCLGLDDAAKIVGYYIPTSNANTAVGFTYTKGAYADFIAAGSVAANGGTQLNAISKTSGVVAGTFSDSSGFSRIFVLKSGKQHNITVAGADYLVATGINDKSQVTAQSFDVNNNLLASYLISGNTVTTIAYPGGTQTTVHVINDAGVVVGAYTDSANKRHGFTYDSIAKTYSPPIDVPNVATTVLLGINTRGTICGLATPANGVAAGIVGTPVKK